MARDRTFKLQPLIKKDKITQESIDETREKATHAKELLKNPYLQNYFQTAKDRILNIHAKQMLVDSTEEREQNGMKTTFRHTAKKEYTLLAGQFRFMEQFLSDLEQDIEIAKMMEEKLKSEELEVIVE